VNILITNEKISLEDADYLWGKDIFEVEEELANLHWLNANVAAIGVACENLSRISDFVNDKGRSLHEVI
jgi:aldehyde:ferredoxin oxidoreductase